MSDPIRIAVLYGSSREGRFCDKVAEWLRPQLSAQTDMELDWIDPLEVGLPQHMARDEGPEVAAFLSRIERADGFIVVTPEYNHSYPAALKHLIDAAFSEWEAKPVGFVSYGGRSGGLRAVEHLRLVFAELSAVGLRDVVSLHSPWDAVDEAGRLTADEEASAATGTLISKLRWWATVLKTARRETLLATAT